MSGLISIEFFGLPALEGFIGQVQRLLERNMRIAVRRTIIWGAQRIAADTPVKTGELVASIGGDVVDTSAGGPGTAKGRSLSLTRIDGLEGVIGTAVKHAIYQELGWERPQRKLTAKQIRFLFATGVFRKGPGGTILYEGTKWAGKPRHGRRKIRGRAMFRKNTAAIRRYFWTQCAEAVALALQGKEMAE